MIREVLGSINDARLAVASYMNTDLINTQIFYFDYWGLIHLLTGILIMWGLDRCGVFTRSRGKQYLVVLAIELLWESFEWVFYSRGIFFASDTPANVGWDIFMNMFGAWIYVKMKDKKGRGKK